MARFPKLSLVVVAALVAVALATRPAAAQGCSGNAANLLFPLDGSYTLVDFFGDGPSGNAPAGSDQRNDDDSATVPLGFTFDLYGDTYTSAFINNNGNVSFVNLFDEFTATGFPSEVFIMVAPFWADVDSRNPDSGRAWQRLFDSNGDTVNDTLIVTWDNVGYFENNADLRNTFQVAISDGTNPAMGLGNNVCFSWDNMCWTTGDSSGGIGGFGGTPSTVGANRGNGTEFFQTGRFDHDATDYDGPFGDNDGVSFLDHSSTCFSTATRTTNVAPIPTGFPAGNQTTLDTCRGESLSLDLQFLSPEAGQTTTVGITDPAGAQGAGLVITNTSGNVAQVSLAWPNPRLGTYTLHFTATDDFTPHGVTNVDLRLDVVCSVPDPICGDADRSGSITVTDGALAFRTATDLLSPCRPETCDMTGTGLPITVSDGANILRLAAGLPGLAQCPLPSANALGSAGQAATAASSTSTIGDRAAKPPSPAALAKLADKCQRELGRQVVKALQQQLSPLDRCISGVFKCVATTAAAADLSVCLAKARPECVEKAQPKVTKGQESALGKIVKRCAAVDLGELRDATGLGYTNVSADCLARQNLDLCDADEIAQCLVAETDLSAARLYGMQAPRAYELYRLVRPLPFIVGEQPLDPFSDLPDFGGGQSPPGPLPASGTDIQKCASTISHAGNAFATRGLATIQKCLTNLFTCVRVKPGDPGCLGTAQAKCATDLEKLTQSTKLEDTIRKGCGTLPFGALLRSDGLNLEALLTICPGLGVPALNGLDDYLSCLRQSQQCRLLDLVRFAVPRGATLLPGDALEVALHGDRCPSPPTGGTLTSAPSARAETFLSGILRFISNIFRGSSSGGYHRGLAPASTASARRRVTDISASRFAFPSLSNRLFVRYTRGVTLARAASPVTAASSSPPALFIQIERADHSVVPDYFDIALPPDPPVGQISSECPTLDECEVAVDLKFPTDLRGCTFNVLVAAGENGEVSAYEGIEQVPAVSTPSIPRNETVFTINGKPGVQAFRLNVRYPLEKGTFAGAKDQVMCALTAGAANVFVPNDKEDGTLLLSAGNVAAFAFPVEVRCTFDTLTRASLKSKTITSKDIKVGVDEITVGGVPADPAALTVKVKVEAVP